MVSMVNVEKLLRMIAFLDDCSWQRCTDTLRYSAYPLALPRALKTGCIPSAGLGIQKYSNVL